MSVIYMLITISIVVALLFFFLFVTAVRKGQYDDSHTPAVRMLFEDELVDEAQQSQNQENKN
ncbi:cbb3-type cytochrome oxidase assembly protein CcoS [Capnocytophaga sp.]|uniref:cbb3-type cytochrome oxidase assembly protein CcoS n=1 Tax=Capnocytophaga sp. TaxID=44737 RepID=UPI0026DC0CBE|nr:cbb3-type cytochrome oxidase assembly protein CcoS [Capnocytophaga sp.]MDO5104808.1 cbb3-type cytochrome oxidase assembly protein CcoS [Capnocytophaga sp.]